MYYVVIISCLALSLTGCGLGESEGQDANNDNPLTQGREAIAKLEIEGDPIYSFKSSTPAGNLYKSKSQQGFYVVNLGFVADSAAPSINMTLNITDPNKEVGLGDYIVNDIPLDDEPSATGLFVIGQSEEPVFSGTGQFLSGMIKITKIETTPNAGTRASGTFTIAGSGAWTVGREDGFEFNITQGRFDDVPMSVVP